MRMPTNKVRDIQKYYSNLLKDLYDDAEAVNMVWLLLEHYFSINRMAVALNPDKRLNESEMLKLHFAIDRLMQHEPLQYVTGKADFLGQSFIVNSHVLIPRQETEQLVLLANEWITQHNVSAQVLDVGTGSGCIAVSLAVSCLKSSVDAIDISAASLDIAKANAELHNAAVSFFEMDMRQLLPPVSETLYDLIVSNPPYVTQDDKHLMRPNVLNYEPALALFADENDPMQYYRPLCRMALELLRPTGILFLEVNEKHAADTALLAKIHGLKKVQIHPDLHGKQRFVSAIKP